MGRSLTAYYFGNASAQSTSFFGMCKILSRASISNISNPMWHKSTVKIIDSKFSKNPSVNFEYARILFLIGQDQKAFERLDTALVNVSQESRPEVLVTQIIGCLALNGYMDKANRLLERAKIIFPKDNTIRRRCGLTSS